MSQRQWYDTPLESCLFRDSTPTKQTTSNNHNSLKFTMATLLPGLESDDEPSHLIDDSDEDDEEEQDAGMDPSFHFGGVE